jgi:hypothetical protein
MVGEWTNFFKHKMVWAEFANAASTVVRRDLLENHGRDYARSSFQDRAEAVGSIAQAKEETWHYETQNWINP